MYSAIRTCVLFVLAIVCIANSQFVYAQGSNDSSGTGGSNTIQGRIYLPSGRVLDTSVVVELQSTSHPSKTVYTDSNGGFSFRSLVPGPYTIVINAGESFEVVRESLFIDQDYPGVIPKGPVPKNLTVPIYLQAKRRAPGARAEIVSAKLSAAPKAAAEFYEKAQLSIKKDNVAQAIAELRQAVSVYNAFSLAWNDLGVLLEKSGEAKDAIKAFRMAVKSDPESFAALLNLGSALAESGQFSEAEKYLAIALSKNSDSFRGHFYMGVTQAKLGHFDIAEQAFLRALKLGGDLISKAHYLLGGVYWATNRFSKAADELEKYLALEPNAKDTIKVRQSITELRKRKE